jgi:peptidoglycan hydrolase CwlO-like protein
MSFKFKFFFLVLLTLFLTTPEFLYAVDKCDSNQCDPGSETYQQCLTDVANFCSKQRNTLSNQISLINSQYELTLTKITQTENSISTLEKEIAGLSVEIGKLEKEINQLSVNYINQIVQSYKLQKKYPAFA